MQVCATQKNIRSKTLLAAIVTFHVASFQGIQGIITHSVRGYSWFAITPRKGSRRLADWPAHLGTRFGASRFIRGAGAFLWGPCGLGPRHWRNASRAAWRECASYGLLARLSSCCWKDLSVMLLDIGSRSMNTGRWFPRKMPRVLGIFSRLTRQY